jgi:tetratricopeptide (TPR) repeat protein
MHTVDPDWTWRWKNVEAGFDPAKLAALESEFQLAFLESALASAPENLDVLFELGELYTQMGRIEEGLEVDRKLVKILPDNPTVHYNLACSLALAGEKRKALKALETAFKRGFTDFNMLLEDDDLESLREEPDFRALLKTGGRRCSSSSPPLPPP